MRSALVKVVGGVAAVIVLAITGLMLTFTAAQLDVAPEGTANLGSAQDRVGPGRLE